MSKQAQVGLFTLIGLLAIFGVFYVLSDLGTRSGGYKVGVHFASAAGLRQAAVVYLSGVPIGAVDHVVLEPDFTTDVIVAVKPGYDIPVGSRYIINAPITGEPSVEIVPGATGNASIAKLPHEIQPIDQQPQGANPKSIAELLEQGSGEVARVDAILGQLQAAEPRILKQLQASLDNANAVTLNANSALTRLSNQSSGITAQLASVIARSGQNVNDLTGTLDETARRDSTRIDTLLAQLQHTTASASASADSLRSIATDPQTKANLTATVKNFAVTAKTLAELTNDLRQVTGNPQTQAQLRDTVANLDASAQRVNALIGQVGGTSNVYGVDTGATPAPSSGQPVRPRSQAAQPGSPTTGGTRTASLAKGIDLGGLRGKVKEFTKDLVQLEVRVSSLTPSRPGTFNRNNSVLLTRDRGPQSDFNLNFFPRASTGVFAGVNDTGGPGGATGNFMLLKHQAGLTYGGGVEYSQAGLLAAYTAAHKVGLEARAYDLRHPTLDTYLNFFPGAKFELFGGARDVNHADRRAVFGLQLDF